MSERTVIQPEIRLLLPKCHPAGVAITDGGGGDGDAGGGGAAAVAAAVGVAYVVGVEVAVAVVAAAAAAAAAAVVAVVADDDAAAVADLLWPASVEKVCRTHQRQQRSWLEPVTGR